MHSGDDALTENRRSRAMTNPSKARRAIAILSVAAVGGLTSWAGSAGAHPDEKTHGITVDFRQKVVVNDPTRINMRRGTEVTTTQLFVVPGGHTPWHYHPGAHVVAVVAGTATVLETDCVPRGEFTAGQGFFDPGSAKPRHIHMLYNSGDVTAQILITDFREPGQALTVPVDPQPADCF
jgi:hypothetical protein